MVAYGVHVAGHFASVTSVATVGTRVAPSQPRDPQTIGGRFTPGPQLFKGAGSPPPTQGGTPYVIVANDAGSSLTADGEVAFASLAPAPVETQPPRRIAGFGVVAPPAGTPAPIVLAAPDARPQATIPLLDVLIRGAGVVAPAQGGSPYVLVANDAGSSLVADGEVQTAPNDCAPFKLPPLDSVLMGFGVVAPAQGGAPYLIRPADPLAPVFAPTDSLVRGFGVVAPPQGGAPYVTVAADPRAPVVAPVDSLVAGAVPVVVPPFAAPYTFAVDARAPVETAPPRLVVGFGVPAAPQGTAPYVLRAADPLAWTPAPTNYVIAGFGVPAAPQGGAPYVIVAADARAPVTAPIDSVVRGFGAVAPPQGGAPYVLKAILLEPWPLPPLDSAIVGFGAVAPPQGGPPTRTRAPFAPAAEPLAPTPSLFAGVPPPSAAVAIAVVRAVFADLAALPPLTSLLQRGALFAHACLTLSDATLTYVWLGDSPYMTLQITDGPATSDTISDAPLTTIVLADAPSDNPAITDAPLTTIVLTESCA